MKAISTRTDDDDNDDEDDVRVVFIYFNSTFDNGCGTTNNIIKGAQNIMAATKTVDEASTQRQCHQSSFLIVNTDWLFDCISCAFIPDAEDY